VVAEADGPLSEGNVDDPGDEGLDVEGLGDFPTIQHAVSTDNDFTRTSGGHYFTASARATGRRSGDPALIAPGSGC
jgi:hypothetical protein